MVFMPRRRVPSAKGRADAQILVPARAAVVAPFLSAFPLALVSPWAVRGVVLAGVAMLLWALIRIRRSDPGPSDGEVEFTVAFGSLALSFAMFLAGLTLLLAVPPALFAAVVVILVREDAARRRKQRDKRARQARVAAHFRSMRKTGKDARRD